MRLIFHGWTALSILLSVRHSGKTATAIETISKDCTPTPASLAYAFAHFPQLPSPLHLLVSRWNAPSVQPSFVVHRSCSALPDGSLLHAGDGLYVSSPELCLAQIAQNASDPEIIFLGSLLCGSFMIDPSTQSGTTPRKPITTPKALEHFVSENPGLRGAKPLRRVLGHITEGAASPPEAFLRMAMTLPTRLGGFGLPNARINYRLAPTQRAQRIARRKTLVPDLLWPELKLDVEYDSDAMHLTSQQAMLDSTKRLALESDGYKVITVTPLQLGNPGRLSDIAREINRCAGRQSRIRCKDFPTKQKELFSLDWSLSSLFNPSWLKDNPQGRPSTSRDHS